MSETTRITFIAGLAHVLSTVLIGLLLGFLADSLQDRIETFTHYLAPSILILLGLYFMWQHYQHHHFHLKEPVGALRTKRKLVATLILAMFLSPCMEIEGFFLLAGTFSWWTPYLVALMYAVISLTGMIIWIRFAYLHSMKFNWHKLEHNAGMITGAILVLTGIASFFIS